MRLSHSMGIPLRRLQDEISSADFTLYMAYDRIDPCGNQRLDLVGGIISQTVARVHGNKRTKISDFMVDFDKPPKKKKTHKDYYAMFKAITIAAGGKVIE